MRSGKQFRLMRKYVLARNEYEECMEDEDWFGADYSLTIVKSCFAEMEKHIAQGKPSGRARRKMDRELPADSRVEELAAIMETVVSACELDGFGGVRDVHSGDMTQVLKMYETYKSKANNQ